MKQFIHNLFSERCYNCESAWTGGNPNPEKLIFCLVCGIRCPGWIWRFPWFIRHKITDKRLKYGIKNLSRIKDLENRRMNLIWRQQISQENANVY